MIPLTRLNSSRIYLNPDLIKRIEETPDTIVTLVNDDHYVVREAATEVIDRIVAYRVRVNRESSFPPRWTPNRTMRPSLDCTARRVPHPGAAEDNIS